MSTMKDAALIHDVARRHAYVFDNGLSHKDFFDLDKRLESEEFALLLEHCEKDHNILEVGCFTGLNLLALGKLGYTSLTGIEFVLGALEWLEYKAHELKLNIWTICRSFPDLYLTEEPQRADRIICFDVLEHQLDVGIFLRGVDVSLKKGGKALFLVPEGRYYYDCGHVAFFPDEECLTNVLDYFFEVTEVRRLESNKLFAVCQKRT